MSCLRTRLEPQLDGSANQNFDCGRATAVMEVDFQTCGLIRPETENIGYRMNNRTGPSDSLDRKKAIESYDEEAQKKGLKPLRYQVRFDQPWSEFLEALRAGGTVGLTIDRRVVERLRPDLSGARVADWSSIQGHIIWARRFRKVNVGYQVKIFDPLYDGRRPEIPDGPRWWPLWLLKRAAAPVHGKDQWGGGISFRAGQYLGGGGAVEEPELPDDDAMEAPLPGPRQSHIIDVPSGASGK